MREFVTNSPEDTQILASQIASYTQPGMILTLTGDLGAGKTTFTQGMARELGVASRVKSPTFNILNTYQGTDFPIYHFDAYRLEMTGAADQGFEDYIGTDGLTIIEWPQFMRDLLPNDRVELVFKRSDEHTRTISINGQGHYQAIEEKL
ncbi:MAG: tRNA (adenosine(37)-N6)-threonylcarbamoyltransferase complex ATPase subunit type 1 TsaE [Leuconostoc fallax]